MHRQFEATEGAADVSRAKRPVHSRGTRNPFVRSARLGSEELETRSPLLRFDLSESGTDECVPRKKPSGTAASVRATDGGEIHSMRSARFPRYPGRNGSRFGRGRFPGFMGPDISVPIGQSDFTIDFSLVPRDASWSGGASGRTASVDCLRGMNNAFIAR